MSNEAYRVREASNAAKRVKLVMVVDRATKELYGVTEAVLDEEATLRRVALFYRGSGRVRLEQDERDAALSILRARAA